MRTVVFGPPKSGTTYLFSIFSRNLSDPHPIIQCFEPDTIDENSIFHRKDGGSWPQSAHILVKILYADNGNSKGWNIAQAQKTFLAYDAKIFLVRDPRDRLISDFFYHWYYKHSPDPVAFECAYQLTRRKESNPTEIPFYELVHSRFEQLEQWKQAYKDSLDILSKRIDTLRKDGWFIFRYEDLVDNKWDALENYLGFKLEKKSGDHKALKRVSRSKTYGNWRRWFNTEDITFFQPVFQDFLKNQHYQADDWKLENSESLAPEQGSEYMYRLFHDRDNHRPNQKSQTGRIKKKVWMFFKKLKKKMKSQLPR